MRDFDVVVVGGGHAGAEAACAAARMGCRTAMVVLDPEAIGRMSCNPAIGGIGKGQLVREVDALGGLMGLAADRSGVQFRMLNTRKGPAVRSPRAQCDREAYNREIASLVRAQPGLAVIAGEVVALLTRGKGAGTRMDGVVLADGSAVHAPAVVLTTGTFLSARLFAGEWEREGGRYGERAASALSSALRGLGLRLGRHKTGTPPRLRRDTIDFDALRVQCGDIEPRPFSFRTERIESEQMVCHLTGTTPRTHAIIAANAHLSPMVRGRIRGTGPRYCPSVEDKVVRFPERQSHLIFLEPEGRSSDEIYPNGISTCLPAEVQIEFLRTIPGLERVEMARPGYAVDYDHLATDQIRADLSVAGVSGLYAAGQINGTSGYEEAAGQGVIAGINAALHSRGEEPLVLDRATAYIGVLIDDLCRVNPEEPYRMFTSRAEFRLLLRSDNADRRLLPHAERLGLLSADAIRRARRKQRRIRDGILILEQEHKEGRPLAEWLRRPEATLADALSWSDRLRALDLDASEQSEVEAEIKYAGYIARQQVEVDRLRAMEHRRIPAGFDYARVAGLSNEARSRLLARRPLSIGEASRIPGVRPVDLNLLLVLMAQAEGKGAVRTRERP